MKRARRVSRKPRPLASDATRILIVDDNPLNSDMLARRLERRGYRTLTAERGKQGLELLQLHPDIEIVLLDIEMPEMNGVDVLKQIRSSRTPTDLPVIMVTARSDSDDVVQALDAGANDYVTKPVDYPVALARIRTHVSLKRSEQALHESEERYALASRGANDGLWDWNLKSGEIYLSPRWISMLGLETTPVGNSPEEWFRRVHHEDQPRLKAEIESHVQGRTTHFESEHRMVHNDGSHRWMLSRGLAVRDAAGTAVRMAGSLRDITTGKISDPLTGLPNRLLLQDRLQRVLERLRRRGDECFSVLLVDIDRFNVINDGLGHVVGDRLLAAVARRLDSCIRSVDTVARIGDGHTIARLGGDEFTLLLENIGDPDNAIRVADRIHRELESPFDLDGCEVETSVSIGIVATESGYDRADEVLRDADTAMNRAKASGGGVTEVFDAEMRGRAVKRFQLEIDLRKATEREEWRTHYQPIISVSSGEIVGFEALVRWQHPQRGLIAPSEFIPLAEETGLIVPLSQWILRHACSQLNSWKARLRDGSPLMISVNLSAKHLSAPDLIDQIGRALDESGLKPSNLKLEITESAIVDDPERAATTLAQIKAMQVNLAIDDFGTGYSSLTYLHRFPVDTLKIDRSFVGRIGSGSEAVEMVHTIVSLAHNLGMDVIAEGVESADQLALLQELGCEYAQGFLFSRPVDKEAAEALLLARPFRTFAVVSTGGG